MQNIKHFSSLVAISHTVFALPFALVGYMLSLQFGATFSWKLLILVLLCMFWARNAAMSFNRIADARIDALNPRTKNRPIPAKTIPMKQAIFFCSMNCALFIATTYFINSLCFTLSFLALFIILGYSLTKKISSLTHFVLGLGLSLAPLGAFIAMTNQFTLIPFLFSFVVLFWVAGFDIVYALQDKNFDKAHKLYSIPTRLGYQKSLWISRFCHLICLILLIGIGTFRQQDYGILYYAGVLAFGTMLFLQHYKLHLFRLTHVNRHFFIFDGWASIIFFAFFFLNYLCKGGL